jgi:hypothetical protein
MRPPSDPGPGEAWFTVCDADGGCIRSFTAPLESFRIGDHGFVPNEHYANIQDNCIEPGAFVVEGFFCGTYDPLTHTDNSDDLALQPASYRLL